jgi:hypothetical protein
MMISDRWFSYLPQCLPLPLPATYSILTGLTANLSQCFSFSQVFQAEFLINTPKEVRNYYAISSLRYLIL